MRIAKWKVAKQLNYKWENREKVIPHHKGEWYPVDYKMNVKRF